MLMLTFHLMLSNYKKEKFDSFNEKDKIYRESKSTLEASVRWIYLYISSLPQKGQTLKLITCVNIKE